MSISAKEVRFDAWSMWVEFRDGRVLSVPLAWFPRLLDASPTQRRRVKIEAAGLHWEELGEEIALKELLAGRADRTSESAHFHRSAEDTPRRRQALGLLAILPQILDIVHKLPRGEVFRAVMSEKNAHLFAEGADGLFKTLLRDSKGRIIEIVDLERVAPDFAGAFSNALFMWNMAAIASRLDAIEIGVRNIARLIANAERARSKGALNGLAAARVLANPTERRSQMLAASLAVQIQLEALAGQLRAHIEAMPSEKTGWLDGFVSTRFAEAEAAYSEVQDDIGVLIEGLRDLALAYQDLEETEMVRHAIPRLVKAILHADLKGAIRKAGLIPFRPGVIQPRNFLISFAEVVSASGEMLLRTGPREITVDFRPEELGN